LYRFKVAAEALIIAAENGFDEMISRLLISGPSSDDARSHALFCANIKGFETVVKLLDF
jgi:hypothetical protein